MSLLEAYKGIVSQVYKLTQLSYQHRDSSNEFDSFLDHLQDVLEHKEKETIHIPPHVEIIHDPAENVVVVKDETVKNITLRHLPPTTEIQADEHLEEMNELIPETPITEVDDGMDANIARDTMETILDEDAPDIVQEIANAEAEAAEAAEAEAEAAAAEELKEEDEEDDDEDNDLYVKTQKKVKYFVSAESKRVYQYIDDTTRGLPVGKLENGKIVLM
jgi:hypothetical protein